MKVYLVSYDYRGSAASYEGLFKKLRKFSGWWHYMKNTWLVRTEKSAQQIVEYLEPELDDDISLIVVEVSGEYQGWLTEKAWKWIDRHLD